MNQLLNRLLQKRGIKDLDELDAEEKQTYETWQGILSKEELTLQDVKRFCASQIEVIEGKWADLNTDSYKKGELVPYHTVYKTLLNAIDSPKAAREALEIQLNQLLN